MAIRNIISSEYFDFEDAKSLRDWLNRFPSADLKTLYFMDTLIFHYETEVLSDGSEINNIRVS